jgi:hypothetical protein
MNDDLVSTTSQNPGRVQSDTGFESPVHMFRDSCIKGDRAGGVIQEGKGRIESPENLNNFVGYRVATPPRTCLATRTALDV